MNAGEPSNHANPTRLRKDRNQFQILPPPKSRMTVKSFPRDPAGIPHHGNDPTLSRVADEILGIDEVRSRIAWTLRDSLDETLDGGRTGRWCYQHLTKTEKTALGTAVEVNLTKEFRFADGSTLDWSIAGAEVDCKFSKDYGGWAIPMEMYRCEQHGEQSGKEDHIAMLLWMDDDEGEWSAGLVRITDERLAFKRKARSERAYNRDNKRVLSIEGLQHIYWLWGGKQDDLPENVLLQMAPDARARIFSSTGARGRSGQQRVNQLFREVQGRIVNRTTVQIVAQQDDPMKRARDARLMKHLGHEGIMILGHQEADPMIAELLHLPIPLKGEFVAVRVAPSSPEFAGPKVNINNGWWQQARHFDEPCSAPTYDRRKAPTGGWLKALLGYGSWNH